MAVPKKRTSKSKRSIRKTSWKKKAELETKKAFSLPASRSTRKKVKLYVAKRSFAKVQQIVKK